MSSPRNNPQIWRVAEYLYYEFEHDPMTFSKESDIGRNFYYDRAHELLKKIEMKEFTGQDSHSD